MKLNSPFLISSRLLPAVKIGEVTISIEPTNATDHHGKTKWRYYLDGPSFEESGSDLAGWGNTQEMMECLLSFLEAAAESYRYNGNAMKEDSNTDLFPENVCEWAYSNSDEIGMLRFELEENKELVED